ncbi:secreted antigen 1 [Babesia caballi]|uniref:Secreted antigen 1 n=1 Tax=Babesia caballi TaxID=5871 RepID=A0AAV4LMI8_BABCB|nr:secreted antigen 1 [Babesia caballi]
MPEDCEEIDSPQTLKDALDFLTVLNDNSKLSRSFGGALKIRAERYFSEVDRYADGVATSLQNVLDNASALQKLIRDRSTDPYGEYAALHSHFDTCTNDCINKLLSILPKLHATLYYLRFNVDSTFEPYGGGQWATLTCDDGGYLNQWLQDSSGTASTRRSEDRLFPGGYGKSQLRSMTGRDLAESLQSLVNNTTGGHLQNLLLPLIFLFDPWYYYNTSLVLAFVKAFCEAVKEGDFGTGVNDYRQLKSTCAALSETLNDFTGSNNSSGRLLVALYNGCVERYKTLLKVECYTTYVSLLRKKLGGVFTFLQNISMYCKLWNDTTLQRTNNAGPFPYGFMFGEAWKSDPWHNARQKLHAAIKKLWEKGSGGGGSLQDFIEALKLTSGSPGQGSGSAQHPGSSGPGSDGPRKPGSSGTLSASVPTVGAAGTATSAQTSTPNSDVTTPANPSGSGESAENSTEHTGQETVDGPTGAPQAAYESSVSSDSTVTIGSAAGGVALLGGGGAALYFLNVGGIKTLITGVP